MVRIELYLKIKTLECVYFFLFAPSPSPILSRQLYSLPPETTGPARHITYGTPQKAYNLSQIYGEHVRPPSVLYAVVAVVVCAIYILLHLDSYIKHSATVGWIYIRKKNRFFTRSAQKQRRKGNQKRLHNLMATPCKGMRRGCGII